MGNWKSYKLKNVANITTGFPFKGKDYSEKGIRVVRGENVTIGNLRWDTIKCWDKDFDQFEKYSLVESDVVIGMDGSRVGKNRAQIKKQDLPLLLAQRVACVRAKKGFSQDLLAYLIKSPQFENYVARVQTGTSIPHISQKQIEEFEVSLTDHLPTQKAIAEILSSLDDKIELNNQINQNLEALAQVIFKQWFVDFEFPNENGEPYKSSGGEMVDSELGEIPKGWKINLFEDLVKVKYGKDHKKLNQGKYPVYGSGGIMRFADQYLYNKPSILIPRKGTLTNLFLIDEPFWSVDTMFYTEIQTNSHLHFLFHSIKQLDIASMNVGSAVPSMTTKVLNQLRIVLPLLNLLLEFNSVCDSFFQTVQANKKQNQELSNLRDTLLPRLISGELEINDINLN